MRLIHASALPSDAASAVHELAAAAESVDGHPPLSEQALLHLTDAGVHVLALDADSQVIGYGYRADGSAEIVVAPGARRSGVGTALLAAVRAPGLQVWAHGDGPAARGLAARAGFRRGRVLLQMRLDVSAAALGEVRLPEGIALRTFVVGRDEQAWTALNAVAFTAHPEQGTWGVEEVLARERTSWFDPEGFLVAERQGRMVGFHWTKTHSPSLGEVYVLGVHPQEQGSGLGSALTLAGLHHLRSCGISTVLLYVDEDNGAAVRVYARLGFAVHATDVQWAAPQD